MLQSRQVHNERIYPGKTARKRLAEELAAPAKSQDPTCPQCGLNKRADALSGVFTGIEVLCSRGDGSAACYCQHCRLHFDHVR